MSSGQRKPILDRFPQLVRTHPRDGKQVGGEVLTECGVLQAVRKEVRAERQHDVDRKRGF